MMHQVFTAELDWMCAIRVGNTTYSTPMEHPMPTSRISKNPTSKATVRTPSAPRRQKKSALADDAAPTAAPTATAVDHPTAAQDATKPRSGLEAAAHLLREANEPLDAQTLVKRMLDRGLWTTAGKTPAATIYAAMIREITTKGPNSRFRKVVRGRFTAAS
jgi:hypothetical protein